METSTATWLQQELDKRGITGRQLAKEMRVSPTTVYRVLNEERGIGRELARKIAKALDLPPNVVFYRAGYSEEDPNDPIQRLDPISIEVISMLENRSDSEKAAALATVKALFASLDRGRNGRSSSSTR